ncbi:hypothetical protein D3C78_917660 [compost metagenome]
MNVLPVAPAMLTKLTPLVSCHWKVNCGLLRPSTSTRVDRLAASTSFRNANPRMPGPAIGALFADESTISSVPLAS